VTRSFEVASALSLGLLGCNTIIGADGFEAAPAECATSADCPVPADACSEATCTAGACGVGPRALGAACTANGGTTCDGKGSCVACVPPADVPPALLTGDGCGGPSCTQCPDGQACLVATDCLGKRCDQKHCGSL
jgi:hypothetical protein